MEPVLLKYINEKDSHKIDFYLSHGGYNNAKKALKMDPLAIIDTIKKAKLRGRGGAGFPTGVKWSFVPRDTDKPVYLVANADESEPGTFKDRAIIENDPHMLLEGIIIASYAINSHQAYIYIRGEMPFGAQILNNAIKEARKKGVLGKNILGTKYDLNVTVVRGGGAYVCGEETALLSSIEGKRGYPKLKPPFPAVEGLFGCPTIINNVETLSVVPHIIEHGTEWYCGCGTEDCPGLKIFCVSGHVKKPGLYELPHGITLRSLIYDHCGGMIDDHPLKGVIPGGSSCPVLTADEIDVKLDVESLAKAGSMLGAGAVTVMNDTVDMVDTCLNLMKFYAHESCGQCTPCREGLAWIKKIVQRIKNGKGRMEDLDLLNDLADSIQGKTICPLSDAACMPLRSYITKFRHEFVEYIQKNN